MIKRAALTVGIGLLASTWTVGCGTNATRGAADGGADLAAAASDLASASDDLARTSDDLATIVPPPTIGIPTITTPFDDGVKFFKPSSSGAVTVTATVLSHAANVDDASVALHYQVSGQAASTVSGAKTSTDADGTEHWSFLIPRTAGLATGACGAAVCDGSAPLVLTVSAQDNLGQLGTSATASLFFDGVAPQLTIAADPSWNAATSTLAIAVTVSDAGSGVDFTSIALTDGSGTTYPTGGASCAASPCIIHVPAADFTVPSGRREGTLNLSASAHDKVGNAALTNGSRRVDGEAPVITITKIYPVGGSAGAGVVTYPTAIAGSGYSTGYDGSHFVFRDSVHVQATVADTDSVVTGSGVKVASLQARLDGLSGGGVATGTPITLTAATPYNLNLHGCTDGAATCNIEFDLPLTAPFAPGSTVSGNFGVAMLASDLVGNSATSMVTSVGATRFWWSRQIPNVTSVAGLAIHPNGAVIVTAVPSANQDGVLGLFEDGPLNAGTSTGCAAGAIPGVRWCLGHDFYAAANGLGAIRGAATIGDDGNGQLVYVGTTAGDVVAISGAGATQWKCGKVFGQLLGTPAVATSKIASPSACEALFFATGSQTLLGVCNPTGSACANTSASSADTLEQAVIVAASTYYIGTNNRVAQGSIVDATGLFGTLGYFGSSLGLIDGLAWDGTNLYASSNAASAIYQFTSSLTAGFTARFGTTAPEGLPVVRATGLLASDAAGGVRGMALSAIGTISPTTLTTLVKPGYTPLLGSDGRAYVASQAGVVTAIDESAATAAWTFSGASGDFNVPATMDCSGHLYAAAVDTVYAFVTDAQGLRNTAWPKYQRDARNTGNADRSASNGAPYGSFNGLSCVQ